MKSSIFTQLVLSVSLLVANCTFAQINKEFKNYRKTKNILFQKGAISRPSLSSVQFGNQVASTTNFDIYQLKLDNMPCLVPNRQVEISFPIYNSTNLCARIPNPFDNKLFSNYWFW